MKRPRLWEIGAAVFLAAVLVLLLLALGVAVENRLHPGPWVLKEAGCGLDAKLTVYLEDLPVDRFAQVCGFDVYYRGSSEERGGLWYKFKFVGYGDEQYLEVSKDFSDKRESRVIMTDKLTTKPNPTEWIGVVWLNPKTQQITLAADLPFVKEKKPV